MSEITTPILPAADDTAPLPLTPTAWPSRG